MMTINYIHNIVNFNLIRNTFFLHLSEIGLTYFLLDFFNAIFIYISVCEVNYQELLNVTFSLDKGSISESVDKTLDINNHVTINVNTPIINLSEQGINNIAAALSSAGGVTVGLKVAQSYGGTLGTKIAICLTTMLLVQGGTVSLSKILNRNGRIISNNLILNLKDSETKNNNFTLNNYSLSLLSDIDLLINIYFLFLFIFFNVFVANYIFKSNYNKHISKNKFGNILGKLIKRYINI